MGAYWTEEEVKDGESKGNTSKKVKQWLFGSHICFLLEFVTVTNLILLVISWDVWKEAGTGAKGQPSFPKEQANIRTGVD